MQKMQKFSFLVLLTIVGGDLSDPPYKLHFHEPGRYFGNPMGAARLQSDGLFHFYFATPLEDPTDPQPDDHIMGAVGHATSPDLVQWHRQWPALTPKDDCLIDGGSVIEHDGELVMYFAERCCETLDCATEIYRATSNNGFDWSRGDSALLAFNEAPFLTLPSVVYDSVGDRWVMTLSGANDDNGYQPTFYHSADGIDNWTAGGLFVPPAVDPDEGGPAHFQRFTNNFLVPMDDKWVMMGTREPPEETWEEEESLLEDFFEPVFFIGTLDDTTGVFESDFTNRGRALFWDAGARPFPVWNHEVHQHVMMNVIHAHRNDPYQPLSLPVWFEPAVGTNEDVSEEYLRADWIDAVKERVDIEETGEESPGYEWKYSVPEERKGDVLVFNMTVTKMFSFEARDWSGIRLFLLRVYWDTNPVDIRWEMGGKEYILAHLPSGGEEQHLSFILDQNVVEMNYGGWMIRDKNDYIGAESFHVFTWPGHIHAGWTRGTALPTQPDPPTPTTSTSTTTATDTTRSTTGPASGPGSAGTRAKASVAMALFFLCFIR